MYENIHHLITILGITVLYLYCATKILDYYGIDESTYGVYVMFYVFLMLNIIILG